MESLDHRNVVRVREKNGRDGKNHYFVMDYVPGGDLHRRVCSGAWRPELTLPTLLSVADALHCAHESKLVHRDVKPANILLDQHDVALLTDFDLVFAADTTGGTRTGAMGTVIYAAPEAMVDGGRVDGRADVYSLSMVAIFMLRGSELPFDTLWNSTALLASLDVAPGLKRVLEQGIARAPSERFHTIRQFAEALAAASASHAAPAGSPSPLVRAAPTAE
jgi:serine/threonine protein kinase